MTCTYKPTLVRTKNNTWANSYSIKASKDLSVKIYLSLTIDGKQLESSDEVLPCVTLLQVAPWEPRSPAAVLPTFILPAKSYFYINNTRTKQELEYYAKK